MDNKITAGTIIRTICLALALTNQILVATDHSVIPIDNDQLEELLTSLVTIVTSIIAWWKNNSFTRAAIMADETLRELRASPEEQTDDNNE